MAVDKIKADDLVNYEIDEFDKDPAIFSLHDESAGESIWDTVDRINAALAPHNLGFITGIGDLGSMFAKLVRLEKKQEPTGWECDSSPTGRCIYDEDLDSCSYCGHPEERK